MLSSACLALVAMTSGLLLAIHILCDAYSASHDSHDGTICLQLLTTPRKVLPVPVFCIDMPEFTEYIERNHPRGRPEVAGEPIGSRSMKSVPVMIFTLLVSACLPTWAECPLDHFIIGRNRDGIEGIADDRTLCLDCERKCRNSGATPYENWFYPLLESVFPSCRYRLVEPSFDVFQAVNPDEDHTYNPNHSLPGVPELDYRITVECVALSRRLRASRHRPRWGREPVRLRPHGRQLEGDSRRVSISPSCQGKGPLSDGLPPADGMRRMDPTLIFSVGWAKYPDEM